MERSDESNESGYDGGSQENILSEPRYETVGKPKEKQELNQKNGKQTECEDNKKNGHNAAESTTKPAQNGSAKFCNGESATIDIIEEKECVFEGNKVTIHAVIETVRADELEEVESNDTYDNNENIYEKVDEVRERSIKKDLGVVKPDLPTQDQERNKEVVYSHVTLQKTIKKPVDIDNKDEKKVERRMVQELVKVAEEEGVLHKVPSPPPPKKRESKDDAIFVEEEYSYEPELKKSSSKLVMRTRSLLNLEEENTKSDRTYFRPPAVRMKITTGPDGTFVIDGRKATSELNIAEECRKQTEKKKITSICGEELRKRKEEIFRPKETPKPNANKYHEEINQNKTRTTKEEAIHNLKKYLKENNIGLRELLTNNNVVIIDTYREKKVVEDLAEYNHKSARECRVTGTTAKGEARDSHTLPRASKVQQPLVQRHYFYRLFKSRPSPPDEELPDPDKVRSTRQMFQKSKEKIPPMEIMLPIAAKVGNPRKEVRPTPEVRLIKQADRSPRRWTDTGSLSSGVSSDMSLLDNLSDKCYSSDEEDDGDQPLVETHPVSPEVLNKIRACGTTITYYGGRVISHSHGAGNPMTTTIMDEIRQGREGGRGKFRLIKSNSCGSRLELAGTEEMHYQELSRGRFYEDVYGGKSLCEEMKACLNPVQEEKKEEPVRENNNKGTGNRREINGHDITKWSQNKAGDEKKPVWRELIESRKQKRVMEHNRRPISDMVFEEFQVLET